MNERVSRLVGQVLAFRHGDGVVAALMFAYSFLAMTSYNILKPLTRSSSLPISGRATSPTCCWPARSSSAC